MTATIKLLSKQQHLLSLCRLKRGIILPHSGLLFVNTFGYRKFIDTFEDILTRYIRKDGGATTEPYSFLLLHFLNLTSRRFVFNKESSI